MKASVDRDLCIGCGPCEEICPEVFHIEGDFATVICDEVPANAEDTCRQAMKDCPTMAISIEE